ncbi:MAG: hypothetical protein JWO59_876 [Chloroflexi bacterium]|jgi:hypothetical protein|nr:hypothetical protein [Chloroflexota bacterium]MDB5074458.1 hypothetical protein [Chloroflexota bacterium]
MTNLLQRDAVVGPDGTIEVPVPELAPGQRVRVTVELALAGPSGRAIDVLAQASGHRLFKTASEVDAYIRAEREAWDR